MDRRAYPVPPHTIGGGGGAVITDHGIIYIYIYIYILQSSIYHIIYHMSMNVSWQLGNFMTGSALTMIQEPDEELTDALAKFMPGDQEELALT